MRYLREATVVLGLAVLVGSAAGAAPTHRPSATLKEFDKRVDAYRTVRAEVVARIGKLPETNDPAVITRRQHQLGNAIRDARADARPGAIFTPEVAALIRRVIAQDLAQRRSVDRRAFVVEQPDIRVGVNDFYPTTVPLATVPPRLLTRLPHLPDGLEYRFVGSTLILRDVDPNLVVDVLPGAIPDRYRKQ